jgi:hypothetical protein
MSGPVSVFAAGFRNELLGGGPPTRHTTDVLRAWAKERAGAPDDPVFPSSRGRALSRDAVALIVTRQTQTASDAWPMLATKTARRTCSAR